MTELTLNAYAERIHQIAADHGFWEGGKERNFGEMIALAHSELSEALEEHRSGTPHVYILPPWSVSPMGIERRNADGCPVAPFQGQDIPAKPEGVAVELADCIIRCLDVLHSLGVDIDQIVADKLAYNTQRPHKHGKAY